MAKIVRLKKSDVGRFVHVDYGGNRKMKGILVEFYKEINSCAVFSLDDRVLSRPQKDQIVQVGKYVQWKQS